MLLLLTIIFVLLVLGISLLIVFFSMRGKQQKAAIEKSLDLITLLISVPKEQRTKEIEAGTRDFRETIAVMEPVFLTIETLYDSSREGRWYGQHPIVFEVSAHDGEVWFYLRIPRKLQQLFEKQIHAQYPGAQIDPVGDPPIFRSEIKDQKSEIGGRGYAAAELKLGEPLYLPIKTYKNQESDPLNQLTSALSKLQPPETAVIQFVLTPISPSWRSLVEGAAERLKKGEGLGKPKSLGTTFAHGAASLAGDVVKEAVSPSGKKSESKPLEPKAASPLEEGQLKLLTEKAAKTGFATNIRMLVTSASEPTATAAITTMTAAFSSYAEAAGNSFELANKPKDRVVRDYLFARFDKKTKMILNSEEVATILHLPTKFVDTPNIHWLFARRLPPPANLPKAGTILGESVFRGEVKPVYITPDDRLRHIYMLGKTGVGKTVLFQNLIIQDIKNGLGCAYVDPNGDAIEYILEHIPRERAEDVIYFNPADVERPMGLNLLEWKTAEDRDFLVQEAISMFYRLFDPGQTGIVGPQFEHWFRNAALTVMSYPEGGTLLEIPQLFTDKDFEDSRVAHVTDPVVRAFWEKQMKQTAEYHKSEMLNYFTSKFGRFLTNDMMRNIIGQRTSAFNFREVMDQKKILLINLSKGLIGEMNAQLLGMILVSKLQLAAFSRQDISESERVPFYLYVDEFQNFTTDVFVTILSEARKYKLSLNITNQFLGQLTDKIRDAVLGNAGSFIVWRIGAEDAEVLAKEMEPLTIDDMANQEKFNVYLRLLIENQPSRPFNMRSLPPDIQGANQELATAIKQLSRLKYGRDRAVVAAELKESTDFVSTLSPGVVEGAPRPA